MSFQCRDCLNKDYCDGLGPDHLLCIRLEEYHEKLREFTINQVMEHVKEACEGYPNARNSGIKDKVSILIDELHERFNNGG